jgi:AcrR family transcriptional regulator
MTDTKQRILDAAERLFAEHGYEGTSLRAVIAAAKVNLAAIHYHFHTKQALLLAVVDRRLGPINDERLRQLERCEREAGDSPPAVETVLKAFIAPAFWLSQTGSAEIFMHLMGRLYAESGQVAQAVFSAQFGDVAQRFLQALQRALPQIPHEELMWRVHFMIGAMAHTFRGTDLTEAVTEGFWQPSQAEPVLERLIKFLAGGLKAEA